MDKETTTTQGQVLYSWKVYEHQPPSTRNTAWYVVAGILLVLVLIYAIWAGQWFVGGLALAIVLAVFAISRSNPREFKHVLTDQGLAVGDKFYPYGILKSFWIAGGGSDGVLYVLPAKKITLALALQLSGADVEQIRTILLRYLVEDPDQGNDPIDRISRFLKL